MKSHRRPSLPGRQLLIASALAATLACSSTRSATYDSPTEAMMCIERVVGTDAQEIDRCVGEGAHELLDAGDTQADHEDALALRRKIRERVAFADRGVDTKVALLGNEQWVFPLPLVQANGKWHFDLEAAREEIQNRLIGSNELMTIATLREYAEAQREYFAEEHDGNSHAYARRLISSEGKRDGLYWPSAAGEPASPFGPMVASAAWEEEQREEALGLPPHGYYLRTLCAQGKSAPEDDRSYVDEKGQMTGGCALLAWPIEYGVTGVMTFQVNLSGLVFQKDLGPDTAQQVTKHRAYCADATWEPTAD
jgi:hypothetical protein